MVMERLDEELREVGEYPTKLGYRTSEALVDTTRAAGVDSPLDLNDGQRAGLSQAILEKQETSYMNEGLGITQEAVEAVTKRRGRAAIKQLFLWHSGLWGNPKKFNQMMGAYSTGDLGMITKQMEGIGSDLTERMSELTFSDLTPEELAELRAELAGKASADYGIAVDPEKVPLEKAPQLYMAMRAAGERNAPLEQMLRSYSSAGEGGD